MTLASLCLLLSTLSISPERSQFHRYETIVLSCASAHSSSTGWVVKRNTSLRFNQGCQFGWGVPKESSCKIDTAYPSDTGAYWCENDRGECSNVINLTVTVSAVILEIPPYPVMEGDNVTLSCSYKHANQANSGFPANFYKDGILIGTGNAGKMHISGISKSQEGFYKCKHGSTEESAESQLTVRDNVHQTSMANTPTSLPTSSTFSPTSSPTSSSTSSSTSSPALMSHPKIICSALLFIFYSIPSICCVYKYRKWAKGRADVKALAASYQKWT